MPHHRTPRLLTLAAAALAALATPAAAQTTMEWLVLARTDLAAPAVISLSDAKGLAAVSREPVSFGWALDSAAPLDLAVARPAGESREYWVEVSAEELEAGVPLFLTAPRAVVRLNPAASADPGQAEKAAIDPARLVLVDGAGRRHADGSGMELLAPAEKLAAAGSPFAPGTSAFRVAPALGGGGLTLLAERLPASADRYVLHVFEPESDAVLAATAERGLYLDGDVLRLESTPRAGERALRTAAVDGFVTSPAGRAWPLRFSADGSAWVATLPLDAREAPAPGLWEAHLAAHGEDGGRAWMRSLRVAFAVALPTARFDGTSLIGQRLADGALRASLGVEVGTAGRYELRGVLFATDAGGEMRPFAVSHAAAWLEPGRGTLGLTLDVAAAAAAGLRAPYEVRDLQLVDQSRMGVLHRQERGLRLE